LFQIFIFFHFFIFCIFLGNKYQYGDIIYISQYDIILNFITAPSCGEEIASIGSWRSQFWREGSRETYSEKSCDFVGVMFLDWGRLGIEDGKERARRTKRYETRQGKWKSEKEEERRGDAALE
jgi:hypothetical protein